MTIFEFMRKYGAYIFLLPIAIYFIDDCFTAWHHHHTEHAASIVWENFYEDGGTLLFMILWVRYIRPYFFELKIFHCVCPSCGYKWICDPKKIPTHCPHCGKIDPWQEKQNKSLSLT